jgi:adenine-specific DNA methylase
MIIVMGHRSITKVRKNGIYYTPSHLAEFLVKPLLKNQNIKIFDPAYGEGSLLLAAESILHNKLSVKKTGPLLYGCDREPVNGLVKHLPDSNLVKQDFFNYPIEQTFDLILMNPPYVRHHLISDAKRMKYQKTITSTCRLKASSDLWAYFLVKAVGHLRKGGSIGAILPWSLLQAEYAQEIRKWLAERFSNIKLLALGTDYFDEAQERVILVWLRNFGAPVRSIKVAFSQHLGDKIEYLKIDKRNWESHNVIISRRHNIEEILETYVKKYNFNKLADVADVKIGVVTGCDDFFILSKSELKHHGLSKKNTVPIITSSKGFSGLFFNGNQPSQYLLLMSRSCYQNYRRYISKGIKAKYHLRTHSTRRKPWYGVKPGNAPDAFFPYRASQIPYLVTNTHGVQCTNSIHRIYYKGLSDYERKWVQLSLLSIPGQLSIEAYSKSYGGGLLKIEPNSLKNSIVHSSDDPSIESVYSRISKLLSNGHKVEAMKAASDFVNGKLGISELFSLQASAALEELQKRRLERNGY